MLKSNFQLSTQELHDLWISNYCSNNTVSKISPSTREVEPGTVAITGANGFLALHLIAQLVKRPDIKSIRCLLRSREKFTQKKKEYHLDFPEDKLVFFESADNFWPQAAFEGVSNFIHTAAQLHNIKTFEQLYDDNVRLTQKIVEALSPKTRLHYVSTLSVFASSNLSGLARTELLKSNPHHKIYGGYAQTKYLSEQVVQQHPLSIIWRLGLLTPSWNNPVFQSHEFFPLLLNRLKKLGVYPENFEEAFVDVSAVDKVAEVFVENFYYPGYVRHIASKEPVKLSQIIKLLNLQSVALSDWVEKIKDLKTLEKSLLDFTFFKSQALKNNFSRFNVDLFQSTGHDWAGEIDSSGYIERYVAYIN